ncbi:MAG: spermidine/putrescine ABC transporter substrate-binding protein [Nitrospirae bacterium]|nr:MAG: spermidine/putrescine ABC transporter substrate-binding protein [Nitrospirota bacterium]
MILYRSAFLISVVYLLLTVLAACSPSSDGKSNAKPVTLHLFTWSDYTEETVVKQFDERFGIKVVTDTFGSNEELLAKLQGGAAGYDVVVPSDYMVSILVKQGLLAELDHAKIPNLAHVYKHLKGLYYDPQNTYSVPYLWGTTGIGYNADLVKPPPESWQVLWDARYKGKISLLNDEREVFGMALRAAGESLNATQPAKLEAAKARLMAQKALVKTYTSENYDQLLVSGEVALAHGWSGTILRAADERPSIKYVIPKEGGTIWQDNLCVLKSSAHQGEAMAFINFLLEPRAAALITSKVKYASASEEARLFVPREIAQNPAIYPPESVVARLEWIKDVGEAIKLYDRAWTELKVK